MFTYSGNNKALLGFLNAIVLVMETGFALTAFLAIILNMIIQDEIEDETPDLDGEEAPKSDNEVPSVNDEDIKTQQGVEGTKANEIEPEKHV